ncbi:hypothetical protein Poli38472_009027 [Pythium oligandrum]|uniref:F-box/LRR-repeat protein 15-like leucin rich repeat domain-containing protein n=1 Tax=Pythium oligandrum TaxID=41045 RepID=A0A8K1FID1_PYTOL|nr:hypothetical protein Poli38472_009027 [Pythium oligandrum]|eukprot:TMW64860.1 hypothetical protein Poli38472_009027 [Pythium oligandrum]
MGMATIAVAASRVRCESEVVDGEKQRKVLRLHAPVAPEDIKTWDKDAPRGKDGLDQVTSEALQQILDFLPVQDRFAVLTTRRGLLQDTALATTFTSYCGECSDCDAKQQHLCKNGDNNRPGSFWRTLLRYSGASGLRELHLASCDGFSAELLSGMDPRDRQRALEGLQVLDLNRCTALGPQGLLLIAESCRNLRQVHFRDMPIDHAAFERLVANNKSSLRVVNLLGCHTMTGEDVGLLSTCPELRDLNLQGCHMVDNAAVADLVRTCGNLERLNLRYCHKVDDALVKIIASSAKKLRDLNLRYCYKVTDASVTAICEGLLKLETLNLSQCNKITDAAIGRIVATLRSLKELRLWGCAKLTSASVIAISEGLPSLVLVDIRSRDKLEAVIGGPVALKCLIQTYRDTLARWEQAEEVGVFKRLPVCAVAA